MSDHFENFKRKFSSKISKKDFNDEKYIHIKSKLMSDGKVLIVGLTQKRYNGMLNCAKHQLLINVPKYKELPEDYINKKILSFGFSTFYEEEKITDFTPLISMFTDNNWNKYDIILHILNSELDEDYFIHSNFSLYQPDYFYKKVLPNELKDIKNIEWKKEIKEIYKSIIKTSNPYTICILKDVLIYERDSKIKERQIQNYIEDFFIKMASVLKKESNISKIKECFLYSSNSFALFPKKKLSYSIYGRNRGFFILGSQISLNPIKKNIISSKEISKYSYIYDTFQIKETLNKKLQRCIHWLGKAALSEDIVDSFIQISIAAESLLTNSRENITEQLSSRLASLLTKNETDFEKNKMKIEYLYGERSKIMHSGDTNLIPTDNDDFYRYVFDGMIKTIELIKKDKVKDELELYNLLEREWN